MKIKWPRGKYNGRRITGFQIKLAFDVKIFLWFPEIRCQHGVFRAHWLGFNVWAELRY